MRLDSLLDSLEDAACAGGPLEAFYPDGRGRGADYRLAEQICARCPVIDACYEYLRKTEDPMNPWGFAAGLRPDQRREHYRQARTARQISAACA